jgi:MFS family permease
VAAASTTIATPNPAEQGTGVSRQGWYCLITVSLGYMLVSWGMNPVSAILPTISTDLQIDVSAAGWVMNAYFLLLVGAVLVVGRIGDVIGHRYVFATGVGIFGLAGVAAGLAGGYQALVVARSLQGIGSAMVFGTRISVVCVVLN